jgi:hypothetical protein
MRKRGKGGRYDPRVECVLQTGNLAAVPAELNNRALADLPRKKLNMYEKSWATEFGQFLSGGTATERMFLTPNEAERIAAVGDDLARVSQCIDSREHDEGLNRTMEDFKEFTHGRGLRVWQKVEDLYGISAYSSWGQS